MACICFLLLASIMAFSFKVTPYRIHRNHFNQQQKMLYFEAQLCKSFTNPISPSHIPESGPHPLANATATDVTCMEN